MTTESLYQVVENEKFDVILPMLKNGADPNKLLFNGLSVLHLSASLANFSDSNFCNLLEYGGNPNLMSTDGVTPLHVAVLNDNCSFVRILLMYGGDPCLPDNENESAIDHAKSVNCDICLHILSEFTSFGAPNNEEKPDISEIERISSDFGDLTLVKESMPNVKINHSHSITSDLVVDSKRQLLVAAAANMHEAVSSLPSKEMSLSQSPESCCSCCFLTFPTIFSKSVDSTVLTEMATQFPSHSGDTSFPSMSARSSLSSVASSVTSKCSCIESIATKIKHVEVDNASLLSIELPKPACVDCVQPDNFLTTWSDDGVLQHQDILIPDNIKQLTTSGLRKALLNLGDVPGPIVNSTRHLYEKRLAKLEQLTLHKTSAAQDSTVKESGDSNCNELSMALIELPSLNQYQLLENEMTDGLSLRDITSPKENRKGFFVYLLLDPRITRNLPGRHDSLDNTEAFAIFVRAIFYVGKGTGARPFHHFKEAIHLQSVATSTTTSSKVDHILNIWNSSLGVVLLTAFHNVTSAEALTREASIIAALGLRRLTNKLPGMHHGAAKSWSSSKKRSLGVHILLKMFHLFLLEGENQICIDNLK